LPSAGRMEFNAGIRRRVWRRPRRRAAAPSATVP
jgi:hypothetical protein